MTKKADIVYDILDRTFPDAKCELIYHDTFELLVAVSLSAQTTDKKVNSVTPILFKKYPDAASLKDADIDEVIEILRPLGLYKNKATNIISLAKDICDKYDGKVPSKKEDLVKLSGVGIKTANVVLAEGFKIPAFAVDTHVARIAKRLGFAKESDDVTVIEKKLMRAFSKDKWIKSHHLFIFFGRYLCKARNPECANCPLHDFCKVKLS